jgi:hypothetical protein
MCDCRVSSSSYSCWIPPLTVRRPIIPLPPSGPTGSLIIQKLARGADDTFLYNITPPAGGITNTSITTVGETGSVTILNVIPGNYTVTEIVPINWTPVGPTMIVGIVPPNGSSIVTFINEFSR